MANFIKLGSLYFDDQPQEVGAKYKEGRITVGETTPGKEIRWGKVGGLLVADQCICVNVSWDKLDEQGLVFGTAVYINRRYYACRCLKTDVGAYTDRPNEWDATLNALGEGNEKWHWHKMFFWGQEISRYTKDNRVVRGYHTARHQTSIKPSHRNNLLGFRPALEYLGAEPADAESLLGRQVKVYGPNDEFVNGRLLSVDNYDLVLEGASLMTKPCKWAVLAGEKTIIDRSDVSWLKEG